MCRLVRHRGMRTVNLTFQICQHTWSLKISISLASQVIYHHNCSASRIKASLLQQVGVYFHQTIKQQTNLNFWHMFAKCNCWLWFQYWGKLLIYHGFIYCIETFKGKNSKSHSETAELLTGGCTLKCSLPEDKIMWFSLNHNKHKRLAAAVISHIWKRSGK